MRTDGSFESATRVSTSPSPGPHHKQTRYTCTKDSERENIRLKSHPSIVRYSAVGVGLTNVSDRFSAISFTSITITICVFERTGIGQEFFFISASVWDSRTSNASVKLLRSSAVFEGRFQSPSPCSIRSIHGLECLWRLRERGEKWSKFCIFGR